MPLTQQDIRRHYESHWKAKSDGAADVSGLRYSSPVEDAVLYPIYRRLIEDVAGRVDGGRVLDVGSGAGRWLRFFLESYRPARLVGVDYAAASVELLRRWVRAAPETELDFRVCDIGQAGVDLGERFDWINVANVLFHIPEPDLFTNALQNLARHLAPGGRICTTEYLPRVTMRTEWMLVRSRYEFEAAVRAARLRVALVRATTFFSNDPMGLDGPDQAVRRHFHQVRAFQQAALDNASNPQTVEFLTNYFAEVERALLAFAAERIADIDLPSQKLVVLAAA